MKAAFDWEDNTNKRVCWRTCNWVRLLAGNYNPFELGRDHGVLVALYAADDEPIAIRFCIIELRHYNMSVSKPKSFSLKDAKQYVDEVLAKEGYATMPLHYKALT